MGGQRDAGLVRAVGPLGLAASTVSMMIGAGIFAVPGALATSLGPYAPLAFLACAGGIGAVAICCAEGGSRMPTSGGIYGYIEAALGPLPGYVAGTLLLGSRSEIMGLAALIGVSALVYLLQTRIVVASSPTCEPCCTGPRLMAEIIGPPIFITATCATCRSRPSAARAS